MKFFRLLTALAVIAVSVSSSSWGIGVANATAPSDPYMWSRSGPTSVRFSSVAVSKDGRIAFAVPDPAAPINPPAKGFRSTNGGATWTQMSSMEDRYWFHVDTSANGQVVFATGSVFVSGAFQSAVFKSVDGGVSWTTVIPFNPSTPGVIHGDVSVSEDGQKVVIGTNTGLVYSANQGASWTSIWSGVTRGVAIAGNGSVIMIQEANTGIHKSTNSGSSWTTVNATPNNWSTIELSTDGQSAVAVANRNGSWGGAFFTHDGGSTWTDAGLNSTFSENQLAIGAISPDGDTMIASSYYSAPRASFDRGVTWTVLPQEITNQNQWTGFAIADPDPSSLVNTAESIIIAVTEDRMIARFGERPPPTATAIQPSAGRHTGGRTVTIFGQGFTGTTSVVFGGVAAQSFTVLSDTQVQAVTPAHPAGDVQVVITSPRGSGSLTYTYVDNPPPVIHSITPSRIASGSASFVTIRGANFDNINDVVIGNGYLDWGFYGGDTIIAFVLPHAAGSVPVILSSETGDAQAPIVFDDALNPPTRNFTTLTNFNPSSRSDMDVRTLARMGEGLVVAGTFTDAGGVAEADCVAGWDGRDWYALGSYGNNGALDCDSNANRFVSKVEAAPDGSVVAYGRIMIAGSPNEFELVLWDGSSWRGILPVQGFVGSINTMHLVSRDVLLIGGLFQIIDASSGFENVAMWDRGQWSGPDTTIGSSAINDEVWEIRQMPSGNIYINGEFEDAGGDPLADIIAMWNGTRWTSIGDDGAGGPRFARGARHAMAVDIVAGVEVLYVAKSSRYPVLDNQVFRFVGGRWDRHIFDDAVSSYGALEVRAGGLVGLGLGTDSRTRSMNQVFMMRSGAVEAFSMATALIDVSIESLNDYAILADGRIAFTVSTNLAPTIATPSPTTRIIIFDPIDYLRDPDSLSFSAPMLPATGASQSVVHAVLIMVMGLSVLVVSRRRFRVR